MDFGLKSGTSTRHTLTHTIALKHILNNTFLNTEEEQDEEEQEKESVKEKKNKWSLSVSQRFASSKLKRNKFFTKKKEKKLSHQSITPKASINV